MLCVDDEHQIFQQSKKGHHLATDNADEQTIVNNQSWNWQISVERSRGLLGCLVGFSFPLSLFLFIHKWKINWPLKTQIWNKWAFVFLWNLAAFCYLIFLLTNLTQNTEKKCFIFLSIICFLCLRVSSAWGFLVIVQTRLATFAAT